MKRGTSTLLLVLGAIVMLGAMWLYASKVTTGGESCGSAMSPEAIERTDYSAVGLLHAVSVEQQCKSQVGDRKWFATMVAVGGLTMLGIGAWGLNNPVADGPPAADPVAQPF